MSRDVYGRPPPRHDPGISRRALFGFGRTALARADVDYEGVAARVRRGWERTGHEPLLRAIEPVAPVLVEAAAVGPGWRVLDAAAGDGNVAVAALERGARVDACDFAVGMVERGRERCPGAVWTVADVAALPYEDARFDAVLSSFGAALAPRARRTAAELVRVVRPGGVVALTAWVPRGLPGRLDELVPLPDGVRPPSDWGVQAVVRRRLEPLLDGLELRTRTVRLSFPDAESFFAALLRPLDLDADAARPALDALLASCNDAVGGGVRSAGGTCWRSGGGGCRRRLRGTRRTSTAAGREAGSQRGFLDTRRVRTNEGQETRARAEFLDPRQAERDEWRETGSDR